MSGPSPVSDESLLGVFHDAATAVRAALDGLSDWGSAATRPGQYKSDLVADEAVVAPLLAAGYGVMSEESGLHEAGREVIVVVVRVDDHEAGREVIVVVDRVDGSTNASRELPWFATSLCAIDRDGPRVALVVDQSSGSRFEAVRGGGARVDGTLLVPSPCTDLGDAVIGLSGYPPRHLGWRQYRALGALALDLCAVAGGRLDAYIDCSPSAHGPWDYLGGLLVCREAGALVVDAEGRELVTTEHVARRTPVAAGTATLLDQVVRARQGVAGDGRSPS